MFLFSHFLKNTFSLIFLLLSIYFLLSVLRFFNTYSSEIDREFETYIFNNSNMKIEIIDEWFQKILNPWENTTIKWTDYLKNEFKIIKDDKVLYTWTQIHKNEEYSTIIEKKYTLFDEENKREINITENFQVFSNWTNLFKDNDYNITFEKKYWLLPMLWWKQKTIIQKKVEIK